MYKQREGTNDTELRVCAAYASNAPLEWMNDQLVLATRSELIVVCIPSLAKLLIFITVRFSPRYLGSTYLIINLDFNRKIEHQ